MRRTRFVALSAVEAVAVSTSDVARDFYSDWAVGDRYYWWLCQIMVDPQEIIVEDPDGDLYRMSYTPNADGTVSFGDPSRVRVEYVDVAAKSETNQAVLAGIVQVRGANVIARFTNREQSRLSTQEGESMREHIARLRRVLGLSAETPDEEVLRVAAEQAEEEDPEEQGQQPPPAPPGVPGEPTPASPSTEQPAPGQPGQPAPATQGRSAGAVAQSGTQTAVTVDAAALHQLQQDAMVGVQERNARLAREDASYVEEAVRVGKVPPSSIPSLVAEMGRSEESRLATRQYLDGLAENVIPVAIRQDNTAATVDNGASSQVEAFMAAHMPDVVARKRRLQASGIPRVTGDGSRLPAGISVE